MSTQGLTVAPLDGTTGLGDWSLNGGLPLCLKLLNFDPKINEIMKYDPEKLCH